jgi:anti-anti-sigma factor
MSEEHPQYTLREPGDGVTVVTVVDPQILSDGRGPLYGLVESLASKPGPKRVVLSLKNVKAINSAAIGVLINFQKRVSDARGSLRICEIDPYVHNVFTLTRVDQLLRLCGTEEEAIVSFRQPETKETPRPTAPPSSGGSWFSKIFGGK